MKISFWIIGNLLFFNVAIFSKNMRIGTLPLDPGAVLSLSSPANPIFSSEENPLAGMSLPQDPFEQPVFVENKGQMVDMNGNPVPFVLFKKESKGLNFYITEKGLTYVFLKLRNEPKQLSDFEKKEAQRVGRKKTNRFVDWVRIDVILKDASIKKENIITEGRGQDFSQYFLGHCPEGIKDVYRYEKIIIKDVYPGIDWIFYNSTDKGLKYDFIVHPGANPLQIKLLYKSQEDMQMDEQGNISIKTPLGKLQENAPVCFIQETKQKIRSGFSKQTIKSSSANSEGFETEITFKLSTEFDAGNSTLIIDPQLFWATFWGGTEHEGPLSVATDPAGNVFATGYTTSSDFPVYDPSTGAYYNGTAPVNTYEAFILKFSNLGVLLWSTFYGGSNTDKGCCVTIDAGGNLFITGVTYSANFPVQNAGTFYQPGYGGQADAFILKFDNAGNRLWATFYGGANYEQGNSIAVDLGGNIFVTGETSSPAFPAQNAGAFFQPANGGGTADAFILKFDNMGNRLWATYVGGSDYDVGYSIVADPSGNIFVTGTTASPNFPVQNSGTFYQPNIAGTRDIFIMKFDNLGNLFWSTYYGGSNTDEAGSIEADGAGNIFISGITSSANFPVQNAGTFYQGINAGPISDAFILKFDNSGNRLWATYYGGSGDEGYYPPIFDNLAIDGCGNVYMSCATKSLNISTLQACDAGFYKSTHSGGVFDILLTEFSNTGVLLWSSYFGGGGTDFRPVLAVDKANNLFLSGEWTDDSAPLVPATYPLVNPGGGAYNSSFSGADDGFISKFIKSVPTLTVTAVNGCGCTGSATATTSGICSPLNYLWSNGQSTQTAVGLCAGTYTVMVANSLCGTVTNTVTINSSGGFTLSPTQTNISCAAGNDGSATITLSGGLAPYSYNWSPSGGTSSTATGLSAGNYSVIVTDGTGCVSTQIFSINQPTQITTSISVSPATCGQSDGSASVIAGGGAGSYAYLWNPTGASASSVTGLSVGNYSLSITDANGCTDIAAVNISSSGGPAVALLNQTNVLCNGGNTGAAAVTVSGGNQPYTYGWSNGQITSAALALSSGSYSVVVLDANGCSSVFSVVITQPTAITATVSSTPSACGTNSGTSSVFASGGTPMYSYLWSNSQAGSVISNLSSGNYSVTITDANGCTQIATANISQLAGPTASISTITQGGLTTLSSSGGSTYSWTPTSGLSCTTCAGPVASPTQTTEYCVYVYDVSGCFDSACVTVFVTTVVEPLDCSKAKIKDVFFPNAFSPNGDLENDVAKTYYSYKECIETFRIVIYNRWGEKIFSSEDPYFEWNGMRNEKPENTGVFIYLMRIKFVSGETDVVRGNLSLLR